MNKNFLKALGPGLIWAGAAVGVSHLVQSTRAGANYGFELIWIVLLANIVKYPFFEFGPRYAASTGKSLVYGYYNQGRWVLIVFLALTITTMFTLQAAITSVTVGLLSNIFPGLLTPFWWIVVLLLACTIIIVVGKYKTLDKTIKVVIVLLTITTLITVAIAFSSTGKIEKPSNTLFTWSNTDIAFLIALVGWMPSAIDISVWHSVWTVARFKQTKYRPKLSEALLDFKIGYIGTAILSLCFLSLGALVMRNSGENFAQSSVAFTGQLINMYTQNIGSWSYYFIAIAAFATMFSTTLTVLDAYPRVLAPTTQLIFPGIGSKHISSTWLGVLILGTIITSVFFSGKMKMLVDVATTLSFLIAPVLGIINYRAVLSKEVPEKNRPQKVLRIYSVTAIVIMTFFAIYFLYWKFSR